MKTVIGILLPLFFLTSSAFAGRDACVGGSENVPLEFDGEFSQESHTGEECKDVFKVFSYHTKHFRVGTGGRTSVLNFSSEDPNAFLQNMTFVGLLGPECDFKADKKVELTGGDVWELSTDGFVDPHVLVTKVFATLKRNGEKVCSAQAEYTGY